MIMAYLLSCYNLSESLNMPAPNYFLYLFSVDNAFVVV